MRNFANFLACFIFFFSGLSQGAQCGIRGQNYAVPENDRVKMPSLEDVIAGKKIPGSSPMNEDQRKMTGGVDYFSENPVDGFFFDERQHDVHGSGRACPPVQSGGQIDSSSKSNNTLKSSSTSCVQPKPKLFYINGMNTSYLDGDKAGAITEGNAVQKIFPEYEVELLSIKTEGLTKDIYEAAKQVIANQCSYLTLPEQRKFIKILARTLNSGNLVESSTSSYCDYQAIRDAISMGARNWYISTVNRQDDMPKHAARYKEMIDAKRPFAILGYSQGSLYANMGFNLVKGNYPNHPVAVFHVGSVASFVAGSDRGVGAYLTLNSDLIVNGVREFYRDTLPGNFEFDSSFLDHRFVDYFTQNVVISNEIKRGVDLVYARLPSPPCSTPAPPVRSCGAGVYADGSSGKYDYRLKLGNQPGTVEIEFEAFDIPDSLSIKNSSGNEVYKTPGMVSGFHKVSRNFEGRSDGLDEIWDISVVGNTDNRTQWNTTIGCPGQRLGNDERMKDRVLVDFKYSNTPNYQDTFCSIEAFVDYQRVYNGNMRSSHSFSVEVAQGQHAYSWRAQCTTTCRPMGGFCTYMNDNSISQNYGTERIRNIPSPFFEPQGIIYFNVK